MVVAEITVIPLVEGSLRPYVDAAVGEIRKAGLNYEVEAMGTTMEGELEEVMETLKKAHQAAMKAGAERVFTEIRIDERKNGISMSEKVRGYR